MLSARDRLTRVQRVKSFLAEDETSRVTAAEPITPPLYVAEIFDLEAGDQVVRRKWLAGRGKTRTVFAVTRLQALFELALRTSLRKGLKEALAGHQF